jgi:GNAT superfamily N-acetyltransferase
MPYLHFSPLTEPLRPLLNKFYRTHNSPMRAASEGQLWVARRGQIIAGLCLTPVAQGQWLTGLFVDPACRGQRLATQLVERALAQLDGPVWLFCHPDLQPFYERLGFTLDPPLPQSLKDRLGRYVRSKSLIAMGIEPLVRSTSENV